MNNLVRIADGRRAWDLFGDVDGILKGFYGSPIASWSENDSPRRPAMNVREEDAAYVVSAELPGVGRNEVSVTIDDNVLTIGTERKEKESNDDGKVICQERYSGKFARSIRLGKDVDEKQISAEYRDGVLTLTIPKKAQLQPRKVEVKVN